MSPPPRDTGIGCGSARGERVGHGAKRVQDGGRAVSRGIARLVSGVCGYDRIQVRVRVRVRIQGRQRRALDTCVYTGERERETRRGGSPVGTRKTPREETIPVRSYRKRDRERFEIVSHTDDETARVLSLFPSLSRPFVYLSISLVYQKAPVLPDARWLFAPIGSGLAHVEYAGSPTPTEAPL